MDMGRSPPQPSPSTQSRFMNAFHRFRHSASQTSTMSELYHQNTTTNSVAPAEIVSTIMKPSLYKRSLADKIKSKFHQQLAKKKNRASLMELSAKEGTLLSMPQGSMPTSSGVPSRQSGNADNKSTTPLKTDIHANHLAGDGKVKLSHSASVSSCLSTCSSSFPIPAATGTTPAPSSAFSLTKSISSHRLYTKSSTSRSSTTSGSSMGSRYSSFQATRQPLHSTHSSPATSGSGSGSGRKSLLLLQQRHHHALVRFTKLVSVRETFSKTDYDRGSDPESVCTRLTPAMAHYIKEELNAYKLHEMQVHELSRVHTHFFR